MLVAKPSAETVNRQRRREWSDERFLRDLERRKKSHAHYWRYTPDVIHTYDTVHMREEEELVTEYLWSVPGGWITLWQALNSLACSLRIGFPAQQSYRQILLAVTGRLIQEGRVLRHRRTNTIALAGWVMQQMSRNEKLSA